MKRKLTREQLRQILLREAMLLKEFDTTAGGTGIDAFHPMVLKIEDAVSAMRGTHRRMLPPSGNARNDQGGLEYYIEPKEEGSEPIIKITIGYDKNK